LGFVEAVDFIDKEDSALRVFGAQSRGCFNAAESPFTRDGIDSDEVSAGCIGDDPR